MKVLLLDINKNKDLGILNKLKIKLLYERTI